MNEPSKLETLLPVDRQIVLKTLLAAVATSRILGVVIEVGVYQGGSLLILAQGAEARSVIGYDTFAGLPSDHWRDGEFHHPGEFSADEETVRRHLEEAGFPNVELCRGLFPFSPRKHRVQIAFAHVNVDFYKATHDAINAIWPDLSSGGVLMVDDYGEEHCPGVKIAVDELAEKTGARIHVTVPGQAWMMK